MVPARDLQTQQTRRSAVMFVGAAAATAVAGAVLALGLQHTARLSDDMWRYPWTSSGAFVTFSCFSALLHGLVIVGLRAVGRSGVAGRSRVAAIGVGLAMASTALLLVGELASIPISGAKSSDTSATIVATIFGIGGIASAVGFVLAGQAALRAGLWKGWRRFTLLATGLWLLAMGFLASSPTTLHGLVGVYGLCLLSIAIALYTQPTPVADADPAAALVVE